MHFVVSGHQLDDHAVGRAVALSHEKYCSATAMLVKTAQVTTSYELVSL
jgi:putative redox protein